MFDFLHKYMQVPNDESKEKMNNDSASAPSTEATSSFVLHRTSRILLATIFVLLGLGVFILPPQTSAGPGSEPLSLSGTDSLPILHCGNSTAEARALGCEFDLLSYSWLPQECLDRETEAEYRAWLLDPARDLGPWPIFTDKTMTERVPDEETLSERIWMDYGMHWSSHEFHMAHCAFQAKRIIRAVRPSKGNGNSGIGFRLDQRFTTPPHVSHCTKWLLLGTETSRKNEKNGWLSYFAVDFGKC